MRKQLIAITVYKGIIQLIDEGNIAYYAQRGIRKLSIEQIQYAIASGQLDERAINLKELPSDYSIRFEDPSIQGRAIATFKLK